MTYGKSMDEDEVRLRALRLRIERLREREEIRRTRQIREDALTAMVPEGGYTDEDF